MKKIWVVAYWNKNEEPILTAFDNKEAAYKCYNYFKKYYDGCCIDTLSIFHFFDSWEA